jgi:predicted lipase
VEGVTSATRVSDYALGVFAFVAYNSKNNEIVASFRGSSNIANWILNIDIHQTTYKKLSATIKVHQGFYNSYLAVKS